MLTAKTVFLKRQQYKCSLWSSPSKGNKSTEHKLYCSRPSYTYHPNLTEHVRSSLRQIPPTSTIFHGGNYRLAWGALRQQMPRYGSMVSMAITMINLGHTCHKYPTVVTCTQLCLKNWWGPQKSGFVNDWICNTSPKPSPKPILLRNIMYRKLACISR